MTLWQKVALTLSVVSALTCVEAATPVNMNINISGTVVANGSCTFDKGETLTVDFGWIYFSSVEGGYALDGTYIKSIAAAMTCTGDSAGKVQMTLKPVQNAPKDYQGQKLLPVKINGAGPGDQLALRLLVDGAQQDVEKAFAIDLQAQPNLQVELVQVGGGGFVSGAPISASATLIMEFI